MNANNLEALLTPFSSYDGAVILRHGITGSYLAQIWCNRKLSCINVLRADFFLKSLQVKGSSNVSSRECAKCIHIQENKTGFS